MLILGVPSTNASSGWTNVKVKWCCDMITVFDIIIHGYTHTHTHTHTCVCVHTHTHTAGLCASCLVCTGVMGSGGRQKIAGQERRQWQISWRRLAVTGFSRPQSHAWLQGLADRVQRDGRHDFWRAAGIGRPAGLTAQGSPVPQVLVSQACRGRTGSDGWHIGSAGHPMPWLLASAPRRSSGRTA
jgi:hypothetical protein